MTKTAVEILAEKLLKKYNLKIDDYPEFKEAKQLEKERMIEFAINVFHEHDDQISIFVTADRLANQ